jgi:hypothetical protein
MLCANQSVIFSSCHLQHPTAQLLDRGVHHVLQHIHQESAFPKDGAEDNPKALMRESETCLRSEARRPKTKTGESFNTSCGSASARDG